MQREVLTERRKLSLFFKISPNKKPEFKNKHRTNNYWYDIIQYTENTYCITTPNNKIILITKLKDLCKFALLSNVQIFHIGKMSVERIILGIDPGTNVMGYGLILNRGIKIELVSMGILKLSGYTDHLMKLKRIFEATLGIIDEYKPDELAIEAQFFGKNVQSMLKLGRAQGVAIVAALYRCVPVFEYSPRKIKQSITGKGSASKEQVAAMLNNILMLENTPEQLDATDGLAVAVCHYFQRGEKPEGKNYSGWKSFIHDNPERIK